jgi:hypothetical protein
MPLFTDGPISSIEDLTAQDSQLPTVASVEGIDVTQKIAIAQDQVAMDLHTALNRFGSMDQLFWLGPQPNLDRVVVTPALKLWHTARSLEMVYSDAYNSQLNDRYAGKRDQFHALAKWAYEKLIEIGAGIASQPVPRAGTPTVAVFPGALADGTYYVTMTWVNAGGEEGAPAIETAIGTTSSTFLVGPTTAPQIAAGWNVYAGASPDAMFGQNSSLLILGQTWEQPATLVQTGTLPGKGQKPSYLQALPRILQRG